MSRPARRGRVAAWPRRPTIVIRLRQALWRVVRVLFLIGAAMGPGTPPPPPPAPHPTEQVADGAPKEDE